MGDIDIQKWRASIADETRAHYQVSMAMAIWCAEGAEMALPWVLKAREFSALRACSAFMLRSLLKECGRGEAAGRIHAEALGEDASYELEGAGALARVCMEAPLASRERVLGVLDQAIRISNERGNAGGALLLMLRRTLYLGDIAEAVHVLRKAGGGDVPKRQSELDELGGLCRSLTHNAWEARDGRAAELFRLLAELPIETPPSFVAWGVANLLPRGEDAEAKTTFLSAVLVMLERIETVWAGDAAVLQGIVNRVDGRAAINRKLRRRAAELALKSDPTCLPAWLVTVKEALFTGRGDQAVAAFVDTMGRDSRDAGWLSSLALFQVAIGDVPAALRSVDAAVAMAVASTMPMAASCRGLALLAADRCGEALAVLRDAVKDKPNPGIECNVPAVLFAMGRYKDALNGLAALPSAMRNTPFVRAIEGCVLQALGKNRDAAAAFMIAAEGGDAADLYFHALIRPCMRDSMLDGLRAAGLDLP